MKKLKSMYKKNKVLFVLTTIAILCMLIIIIGLITSFYSGGGKSKYGDRLDGIEEVKLSNSFKMDLEEFYEDQTNVKSASVDVSGKIVYVVLDVDSKAAVAQAKEVANKGLKEFSEEELDFYDIQFILTCDEQKNSKTYPTMGYKNNTSSKVVWINRNA